MDGPLFSIRQFQDEYRIEGENLGSALDTAGELPQVKMFEWRSYTVAINASSSKGVWYFDYYDPYRGR